MEKLNEEILQKSTKTAEAPYDDLKGCCPPMSESLLKDLFNPVPNDDVDDDYKLVFDSTSFFERLMQSYVDYIGLIYPCMDKLVFHWALHEKGTGSNPGPRTMLEQTYNWFIPNPSGSGPVNFQGNKTFFNQTLIENTWYEVDLGIYTENCNALADKDCKVDYSFHYRWQLT